MTTLYDHIETLLSGLITDCDYVSREMSRYADSGLGTNANGVPYWCARYVYAAMSLCQSYQIANAHYRIAEAERRRDKAEDQAHRNDTDPATEWDSLFSQQFGYIKGGYVQDCEEIAALLEYVDRMREWQAVVQAVVMDVTDFDIGRLIVETEKANKHRIATNSKTGAASVMRDPIAREEAAKKAKADIEEAKRKRAEREAAEKKAGKAKRAAA